MAEPSTVARPYAEAAFRLAVGGTAGGNALAKWSEMLRALALVAQDEQVRAAVADPKLSDAQVAGLFISVLGGQLSGEAENFVRVLTENRRIELLPHIRAHFDELKNEREGVVEAEMHSAFELTEAQVADLVQRLEKITGRKVRAQVRIDKELIGGVKLVLGDKVIDGSARAQLAALETALKA